MMIQRCVVVAYNFFLHVTKPPADHARGGLMSLISSRGYGITERALNLMPISDYNTRLMILQDTILFSRKPIRDSHL